MDDFGLQSTSDMCIDIIWVLFTDALLQGSGLTRKSGFRRIKSCKIPRFDPQEKSLRCRFDPLKISGTV